jgi:hypothetical protein
MTPINVSTHHWFKVTEAVFARVLAIVIGFIMMVLGLGLGVTMIMLPVGVVVGLAGMGLFVAGLFAHINRDA